MSEKKGQESQEEDQAFNLALKLSEEAQAEAEIPAAEQNLLNEELTGTQLFMRLSENRRLTIGLIISQLLGTNGIQVDTNSMRNILQYGREANTEIHSLLTYLIQNQHLPLCMYSGFNLASLDERQRRECTEFRNTLRERVVPVLNRLFEYYSSLNNTPPSDPNLVFDLDVVVRMINERIPAESKKGHENESEISLLLGERIRGQELYGSLRDDTLTLINNVVASFLRSFNFHATTYEIEVILRYGNEAESEIFELIEFFIINREQNVDDYNTVWYRGRLGMLVSRVLNVLSTALITSRDVLYDDYLNSDDNLTLEEMELIVDDFDEIARILVGRRGSNTGETKRVTAPERSTNSNWTNLSQDERNRILFRIRYIITEIANSSRPHRLPRMHYIRIDEDFDTLLRYGATREVNGLIDFVSRTLPENIEDLNWESNDYRFFIDMLRPVLIPPFSVRAGMELNDSDGEAWSELLTQVARELRQSEILEERKQMDAAASNIGNALFASLTQENSQSEPEKSNEVWRDLDPSIQEEILNLIVLGFDENLPNLITRDQINMVLMYGIGAESQISNIIWDEWGGGHREADNYFDRMLDVLNVYRPTAQFRDYFSSEPNHFALREGIRGVLEDIESRANIPSTPPRSPRRSPGSPPQIRRRRSSLLSLGHDGNVASLRPETDIPLGLSPLAPLGESKIERLEPASSKEVSFEVGEEVRVGPSVSGQPSYTGIILSLEGDNFLIEPTTIFNKEPILVSGNNISKIPKINFETFHKLPQREQIGVLSEILVSGRETEGAIQIIERESLNPREVSLDLEEIEEVDEVTVSELFSPDCPDRDSEKALQVIHHLFSMQDTYLDTFSNHLNLTSSVSMQYEGKTRSYGEGIGKQFDTYLMEVFEYGKRNRIPFAISYGEQKFYNGITELLLTTFIRETRDPDRRNNLKMLKIPLKFLFPYLVDNYMRRKRVSGALYGIILNKEGLLENFRQFIGLTDEYLFKVEETDEEKMGKIEETINALGKSTVGQLSKINRLKIKKLKKEQKKLKENIAASRIQTAFRHRHGREVGESKSKGIPRFEMSSLSTVEVNGIELDIDINDYNGMTYEEYIDYFTIFMLFDFIDDSNGYCAEFKHYKDEEKDILFCPYGRWLVGQTSKLNKYFNKDLLDRVVSRDGLCVNLLINLYLFAYEDVDYSADEIVNKIGISISTDHGLHIVHNKRVIGEQMIRIYLKKFLDFDLNDLSDELKNKILKRFKNSNILKKKILERWLGSLILPKGREPLNLAILVRKTPKQMEGEDDVRYLRRLKNSTSAVHTCFKKYNLNITPEQFEEVVGDQVSAGESKGERSKVISSKKRNFKVGYETFVKEIMYSLLSEADFNIEGGGYQMRLRSRRRRRRRRTIKRKRKKGSTKKKNKNKKIKTEKRRRRKRGTRKN